MAIPGLAIIGESINDSVPSTQKLFDTGDLDGIVELARFQDERGAAVIDVNVGSRPPEFMAEMVRSIQQVTAKPLSIDSPDLETARAGLSAYDPQRAGGAKPILNSISPLRIEMFELVEANPFRPILLASEHQIDGEGRPCHTAQETYDAAKYMLELAHKHGIATDECIIDPGIAPIGSDTEGNIGRLLQAMEMIHGDPAFEGVHMSVGLSNFTVMLPPKRPDGSAVKSGLESAFLTRAMPLGLDYVIGSVKRKYELLPPDSPAMQCLDDCVQLGGFESLMRVRSFYTGQ